MSLVDLKVTKAEIKEEQERFESPMQEDVPYGLTLHLEDREIEKLGLKDRDLKVGGEMGAMVMLRITHVNDSESENGGKRRNASMAVVAMDIEAEDRIAKAATALFGDE